MTDYAVLTWRVSDQAAAAQAEALGRAMTTGGWQCAAKASGLRVWLSPRRILPLSLPPDGDGLLVGDVFGSSSASAWGGSPEAVAKRLSETTWGRYVAIFRSPDGLASAIFRDPSGGLDALAWRAGGLVIVASDLDDALLTAAPAGLAIDWSLIGAGLVERLHLAGACPLVGIAAVTPGAIRRLDGVDEEALIWRPRTFARRGWADTAERRAELIMRIDGCVGTLAGLSRSVLAEVSGGLDSSIVASALQRAPQVDVLEWLNYHVEDPGGDERRYARATAEHLGVRLTEAAMPQAGIDLEGLAFSSRSARPSWRLVDAGYDQDLAARCRAVGATGIVSGLGGDTVFMQGGSPWLAADYFREQPIWAVDPHLLSTLARRSRRSIWQVMRQGAVGAFGGRVRRPSPPSPHLTDMAITAASRRRPPLWLGDLGDLTPTKQGQIEGLARTLLVTGRSARTEQADLVNPLLSQPIMELCLSLSSMALTQGGDDRAMARAAFADRLAPLVRDRRSKGDLSRHYGRALARDTSALRELLLGGQLVGAGLVDPLALEAMLEPQHLIWRDPYREIVAMVVLELWVRSWSDRIAGLSSGRVEQRIVEPS